MMALLASGVWAAEGELLKREDYTDIRHARSVHLGFEAPEADVYYNEVTVEQSQRGTYFMVCGFRHGYFGIQELVEGPKMVIFSVWDPGVQDEPDQVDRDHRVKVLAHGDEVTVDRFGGEGTGAKTYFMYDWKVGETYRFAVKAEVRGPRTVYSGYMFMNETGTWKLISSLATLAGGDPLLRPYSFVEDFHRNYDSVWIARRARFSNGWVRSLAGEWHPLLTAKFTADRTPILNVDAGPDGDGFFLVTGGDTINHTPLGDPMPRPEGPGAPPDLPWLQESE
jgi:hypothetical protein